MVHAHDLIKSAVHQILEILQGPIFVLLLAVLAAFVVALRVASQYF